MEHQASMIVKAVFYLIGMVELITSANGASFPGLMITTSPRGPIYPAATWVRVACKHNHTQPHLLQYRWTGSCNSTNTAAVFNISDPFLDEQGWAVIWVKTTPVDCLDYFRCIVEEKDGSLHLTEIASGVFIFEHVSGVGISLPDNIFQGSVPNNSAVVFQEGMPAEVVCHSTSRSSCVAGQWTSLTADVETTSCENSESAAEGTFSSVTLDLSEVSAQGVHSCIVNDERGVEQKLFIGVYQSVPTLSMEQSFHATADGLVVLECDTKGLPPTATLWSRDGVLLTSDDVHSIRTEVLSDYRSAHYRNVLVLSQAVLGTISCSVYSDWVTTDKRSSGRLGVNGFFVIAPLSESITLECAFPEGTTDVEWLNGSTPVLVATGRNNTVVMSLTVTERVHGQTYVCRGRDGHGRQLEQRYVALAQVPADSLSMVVEHPQTEPAIGQQLHLQCCARHSSPGISSAPTVQWFKDGQLLTRRTHHMMSYLRERGTCLTIEFGRVTARDEGEYTCRGSLRSPSMQELLVKEESFELTLLQQSTTTDAELEETTTADHTTTADRTTTADHTNKTLFIILTFALISVVMLALAGLALAICLKARGSCKKANMCNVIKQEVGRILKVRRTTADIENAEIIKPDLETKSEIL